MLLSPVFNTNILCPQTLEKALVYAMFSHFLVRGDLETFTHSVGKDYKIGGCLLTNGGKHNLPL